MLLFSQVGTIGQLWDFIETSSFHDNIKGIKDIKDNDTDYTDIAVYSMQYNNGILVQSKDVREGPIPIFMVLICNLDSTNLP